MDLSVMFFGADESDRVPDHAARYADVLAIARAADALGFTAVWTPERHFQQVGQIFPSPPVLGAALAVATERIGIGAGSVVLPLHHPLRVVEDWAVVDNLSGGRVGISAATGWHSTDFVLAPDRYAGRRERVVRDIGLIRRLWAGEAVDFRDGTGQPVAVRPRPCPVSPTLPMWMTTSGTAATWEVAGRLRTGVLAATVGQGREQLAERIRRYREAYRAAPEQPGSAPYGTVTLMAHAFVAHDDDEVRRRVGGPLRSYLKSYVRQTAANRSGAGTLTALRERDIDVMTEFAFERYLTWGSLLGSPATCRATLTDLQALGCDEVACFVDFGLARDEVLASLHRLAELWKGLEP